MGGLPDTAAEVVGGTPVELYVTLDGFAPDGGMLVRVATTDNSVYPVPQYLAVPAGARSAKIVKTALPVAVDTSVVLSSWVQGPNPR